MALVPRNWIRDALARRSGFTGAFSSGVLAWIGIPPLHMNGEFEYMRTLQHIKTSRFKSQSFESCHRSELRPTGKLGAQSSGLTHHSFCTSTTYRENSTFLHLSSMPGVAPLLHVFVQSQEFGTNHLADITNAKSSETVRLNAAPWHSFTSPSLRDSVASWKF